nr:MAG: ORF2 protein [Jingmen rodent astrovirus 2]
MSFGGADQKAYVMANRQGQKQAKTTVTTVTSNSGGRGRGRRRRPRTAGQTVTTTRTTTTPGARRRARPRNRPSRRNARGKAPATITQTVTATLGTVGSNQGNSVETEMVMLMNPSLTKETTGSNQFGPIQLNAATYAQWRITRVRVKATPIVGASAVSGTIGRISLNMTGNPTSASWSALGARPHADLVPGRGGVLRLNARNFPGPKEGWYNTNTKGDPNMSIGGAIEVHTMGKTMSTYKNEAFTGGLWLIELTATWEFRNYSPQPGLLNMVKGREDNSTGAQIKAEAGQPIEMVVQPQSRMARAASSSGNSEIIWQVADTTIKTITAAFPPPFNWLFQGGWWFIKRIADAPVRAGEERFRVYASIQDARADVPCIASQATTINLTNSEWTYQQVTPGNTGLGDQNTVALGLPPDDPTGEFLSAGVVRNAEWGGNDQSYRYLPAAAIWTQPRGDAATRFYTAKTGFGFSVESAKRPMDSMLTYDVRTIDSIFVRDGREIDPSSEAPGGPPVYFYSTPNSTSPETIGISYAYSESNLNDIKVVYVLFKCLNGNTYSVTNSDVNMIGWTLNRYPTISNEDSGTTTTPTPIWGGAKSERYNYQIKANSRVTLRYGDWYILTYHSKAGRMSLALGGTLGLPSSPDTNIPTAGTWEIPHAILGAGVIGGLSEGLRWTPFVNGLVQFNSGGWTQAAASEVPTLEPMADLGTIPEESEGEDTDYETDPEMLPDMTDTEDESPGCEDEPDAPARPPTPMPGPGEHWENPPPLVMAKMTSSGKKLYYEMLEKGVPALVARRVVQQTHPHPAYEAWSAAYHDALVDGCSPPTARSVAWDKATSALGSRGHAE